MAKADFIPSGEEWRPVPVAELEDHYEVSNWGRVKRTAPGHNAHPGYILKGGTFGGYRVVTMQRNRVAVRKAVHLLVLHAFRGPPENPEHEANHIDGNKFNNHISNLQWCSHQENCLHRNRVLRKCLGANNGNSVLLEEQVQEIRALLSKSVKQRTIAKMFGVTQAAISGIIRGLLWSYLDRTN